MNASHPLDYDSVLKLPQYIAGFKFDTSDAGKLCFKANDTIYLVTKHNSGWWNGCTVDKVTKTVKIGWLPATYIKPAISDSPVNASSSTSISTADSVPKKVIAVERTKEEIKRTTSDSQIRISNLNINKDLPPTKLNNEVASQLSLRKKSSEKSLADIQRTPEKSNSRSKASLGTGNNSDDEEEADTLAILHRSITQAREQAQNEAEKVRQISHDNSDGSSSLPPYWGRKQTPDGREYYFNSMTNKTCWNVEDTFQADIASPISSQVETSSPSQQREQAAPPMPVLSGESDLIPITWEALIKEIIGGISRLNHNSKSSRKQAYLECLKSVISGVKNLFKASGTIDADCPILVAHPDLQLMHFNLISILNELVVAVKTASGVWPPPDANETMRENAGKVLSAVRNFVEGAVKAKIVLITDKPLRRQFTFNSSMSLLSISKPVVSSKESPPASRSLRIRGKSSIVALETRIEDLELVDRMDYFAITIKQAADKLVSSLDIEPDDAEEDFFVASSREIVNLVGIMLAFINEAQMDMTDHEAYEDDDKIGQMDFRSSSLEHQQAKQILHDGISGLISAVNVASDPFAPANAVRHVIMNTTTVLKAVKELIVTTKVLIEKKEMVENLNFERESLSHGVASKRMGHSLLKDMKRPPVIAEKGETSGKSTDNLDSGDDSDDDSSNLGKKKKKSSGKLKKFFGEAVVPGAADKKRAEKFFGETLPQSEAPQPVSSSLYTVTAYLGADYKPGDLLFSMESDEHVKGGTLFALVERISSHLVYDSRQLDTFLFTFRQFVTPEALTDLLVQRFIMPAPAILSGVELQDWKDKKHRVIQIRVYKVFRKWAEEFWFEPQDKRVLSKIKEFAKTHLHSVMPRESEKMLEICIKRENSGIDGTLHQRHILLSPVPVGGNISPPPAPRLPRSVQSFRIIDVDPVELARQLTIIESSYFQAIHPVEALNYLPDVKSKTFSDDDHVRLMIRHSNHLTGWVAQTLLAETDLRLRTFKLKHFIKVAEKCHSLNNFATREAILAALNSTPIYRLKRTWEALNGKMKSTFDVLTKFMDRENNFMAYRQTLKTTPPPCVPYLGLYLTDLTFIQQGNPSMLSNGRLINFEKYRKLSVVSADIQRLQSTPYKFVVVPEISIFLKSQLESSRDIQELHELSLAIEPRDRDESQKVVDALSSIGLV